MENTKYVAVGSENNAKLEAVRSAFTAAFTAVEVTGYSVASGVEAQPMNDEVSIEGATNRATAALAAAETADFGVGLEGNVALVAGHMMLHGWVVIVDHEGAVGIGRSGGVEIPPTLRQKLEAGEELGSVMQEMLNDTTNKVRHSGGANGVLTDGLYTRIDEFTHATQCALARFVNPDLYNQQ